MLQVFAGKFIAYNAKLCAKCNLGLGRKKKQKLKQTNKQNKTNQQQQRIITKTKMFQNSLTRKRH